MKRLTLLPIVASLATLACSGTQADRTKHPDNPPQKLEPAKPAAADVQHVAKDSNAFALDLWAQVRAEPGNLAISPSSISTAFAMTYAGAKGATADELAKALHFTLPPEQLHAAYGQQIADWNDPKRTEYKLSVVNRLFGEQTSKFHKPFIDLTGDHYGAPLQAVDFKTAPDPSRKTINDWVAKQTQDKIKDLLPSGSIDPDTRLVLTNAIYFKGDWHSAFDPKSTSPGEFHTTATTKVEVPMMHQATAFKYAEDPDIKMVEMPYKGGELAMDIIVPKTRGGLADVEAKLDATKLDAWTGSLKDDTVTVTMPKFKLTTGSMALKKPLRAMGMELPFKREADFTAMADIKPLYIDDAYHKVFVEVNEEGTEAAAATAVVITTESAVMDEKFVVADQPFLFLIRDLRSGAVLFMGRVADPSK